MSFNAKIPVVFTNEEVGFLVVEDYGDKYGQETLLKVKDGEYNEEFWFLFNLYEKLTNVDALSQLLIEKHQQLTEGIINEKGLLAIYHRLIGYEPFWIKLTKEQLNWKESHERCFNKAVDYCETLMMANAIPPIYDTSSDDEEDVE